MILNKKKNPHLLKKIEFKKIIKEKKKKGTANQN